MTVTPNSEAQKMDFAKDAFVFMGEKIANSSLRHNPCNKQRSTRIHCFSDPPCARPLDQGGETFPSSDVVGSHSGLGRKFIGMACRRRQQHFRQKRAIAFFGNFDLAGGLSAAGLDLQF